MGEGAGPGVGVAALKVGLVGFEDGEVLFEGVELSGFFGADGSFDEGGEGGGLWLEFCFFFGGVFPGGEAGADLVG